MYINQISFSCCSRYIAAENDVLSFFVSLLNYIIQLKLFFSGGYGTLFWEISPVTWK